MAGSNIYQDLKNALNDFKTFLDANADKIAPAVTALESLVPQIKDLVNKLIDLMNSLKTEIQNLDVSGVTDKLAAVSGFTGAAQTLLQAAEALLPDQASKIKDVNDVLSVVTGLPTLDSVKGDIVGLIDGIVADLNKLKPA